MIRIHTMTAADIELGMRLKTQAGWNQVAADWLRMLSIQPDGCFVAELDGVAVGTAVAFLFGKVAWIAMVLVSQSARGQGIGKALMQHSLDFAESQGVHSVRLDATPLGQPLYERLGFVPQFSLTRFAGRLPDHSVDQAANEISLAQPSDADRILALDRQVTRTDRSQLLLRLLEEQPERAYITERGIDLTGFLLARPGSNAWQLGPCIAGEAGQQLLQHACEKLAGEAVLLDVPEPNEPAMQWTAGAGLPRQRRLLRMCRGSELTEDTSRLWASSGPELG